jgi:hypothetical protein
MVNPVPSGDLSKIDYLKSFDHVRINILLIRLGSQGHFGDRKRRRIEKSGSRVIGQGGPIVARSAEKSPSVPDG